MRRPADKGFSLVELMIALTIGSLIVVALVGLFINSSRTNRNITKANVLVESGRYVSFLMQEDLWHAGLWMNHVPRWDDQTYAAYAPNDVPVLTAAPPDPCQANNAWDTNYLNAVLAVPAQSYDASPPCSASVADLASRVPDTDVLVIRHVETCIPGTGDCAAEVAGERFFQASLCSTDAQPYVLGTSGFTLLKRDCLTVAPKYRFVSHLYFVRSYATTPGDGIPTLVRSRYGLGAGGLGHLPSEPLVEGIEGFRVEFGIDDVSKTGAAVAPGSLIEFLDPLTRTTPKNRGDAVVDRYVRCTTTTPCTNAVLMQAVAARLYLLARAPEPTPGFTDTKTYSMGLAPTMCATGTACATSVLDPSYTRHLFASTYRFANVAGRRDLPP